MKPDLRVTLPFLATALTITSLPSLLCADSLPGEIIKFQQLPLTGGTPISSPYSGPFLTPNPFPITPGPFPAPTTPFPGHDEVSTAYATSHSGTGQPTAWQGTFMADDFADRFTSPVVHVRWWGSYFANPLNTPITRFLIAFESDAPVSATNPFSHPAGPIVSQIVLRGPLAPGSGTFTESLVPGATPSPLDGPLYQYNAELNFGRSFPQQPNTIYWLKIVALIDPVQDGQISWGWHDRDWAIPNLEASIPPAVTPGEGPIGSVLLAGTSTPVWHFQDDAVSGLVTISPGDLSPIITQSGYAPTHYLDAIDGPVGIEQFSKDLAFELYTPAPIPEPASLVLLILGSSLLPRRFRKISKPPS